MKVAGLGLAVFCGCLLFLSAEATQVRSCATEKTIQDTESIQISGCTAPPCKLKKRTKIEVDFKFVPDSDVAELENSVFAYVLGVPLPFVGVDATNACKNIKEEATGKPGCPLKKGTKYAYTNSFDVLEYYPKVKLTVEWALKDPNGKNHMCFKVDSRIV